MACSMPRPQGCTCSRLDIVRYRVSATHNPKHIYRYNIQQSITYNIRICYHIAYGAYITAPAHLPPWLVSTNSVKDTAWIVNPQWTLPEQLTMTTKASKYEEYTFCI